MDKITQKQFNVLRAIKKHFDDIGIMPTYRDLGEIMNVTQPAIYGHCQALYKKGFIRIIPNVSRGIIITDLGFQELGKLNAD